MNDGQQYKGFNLGLPFGWNGEMTEKLFQYIWQYQYFNRSDLQTTTGEKIQILAPGFLNTNQGPDFINAQIRIGKTVLAGSVELHLKTSLWKDHGHHNDPNYKNVILHVVFEHNEKEEKGLPVLVMQNRISRLLLDRYSLLMDSSSFIACAGNITEVKDITWFAWKERLLAERLTRKSKMIFAFLEQNNGHWEESFWWMLARNFGMKVNTEAFEAIARSIPLKLLARHKTQLLQIESLLFGQASLLRAEFKEAYPRLLKREYDFLNKKYKLQPIHHAIHFLRMRPGNFPTIRLAQLAVLIQDAAHLFSSLMEIEDAGEVKKLFDITANDYWHYHYLFDEASKFKKKRLGKNMIDNLMINTIVPMLFAYGLYHKEEKYKDKALRWLEATDAENNSVTGGFVRLKIANGSAFDSQALIELRTQYCSFKHCLQCSVGNALLNSS